ncbi:hypothetical protein DFP72DRAFT_1060787 [Ephemerocybe angulata]|uniref:SEC63 domain-containing protein n=1 Tax=Ephemerocybe angulata TaxID=980116 RepID=A0A8H6MEW3_9AGAR|nr:hypothetical protein DFP72DRAFT_1060787 [Tulosesus angulatus]
MPNGMESGSGQILAQWFWVSTVRTFSNSSMVRPWDRRSMLPGILKNLGAVGEEQWGGAGRSLIQISLAQFLEAELQGALYSKDVLKASLSLQRIDQGGEDFALPHYSCRSLGGIPVNFLTSTSSAQFRRSSVSAKDILADIPPPTVPLHEMHSTEAETVSDGPIVLPTNKSQEDVLWGDMANLFHLDAILNPDMLTCQEEAAITENTPFYSLNSELFLWTYERDSDVSAGDQRLGDGYGEWSFEDLRAEAASLRRTINEAPTKIIVLLQAYISGLKISGCVLVADMVFLQQSAGRILRVIEIYSKRAWATPAKSALDKRMRPSVTPLRSFLKVPSLVIQRQRESNLRVAQFAQGGPSCSSTLSHLPQTPTPSSGPDHQLLSHSHQPFHHAQLRIDPDVHGGTELFHIFVEEVDGTVILFHDIFTLRQRY